MNPRTGRREFWWLGGLMVLAGVLDFLGFIGFGLYPLTWIAKVPALLAIRGLSPGRAFRWGILYGAVGYFGGYYWLGHTFSEFLGLPAVVSYLLVLLVATGLGLMFALLLWCVRFAECRFGLAPVWTLPIVYPALEFIYPNLFPYNIGASQYPFSAITQVVELTGLLGLTALIGAVNGAFFEWIDARISRRRVVPARWIVPAAAFLAVVSYGIVRIGQVESGLADLSRMKVALLQPNLGNRRNQNRRFEYIDRQRAMTHEWFASHPDVDLIVWPEVAVGDRLSKNTESLQDLIQPRCPMVVGAIFGGPNGSTFNSMLAVEKGGRITGRYDKVHLIPFSETNPLIDRFPAMKSFLPRNVACARGTTYANLKAGGQKLLPLICYEDVLPSHLRELWRRAGPAEALVNVSNDYWFGDSHEPLIHLVLASFRSIESRRPLIRSTNTGISAFVDPVGRIVTRSGQWRSEVLVGEIPLVEDGSTTFYLRHGDWFGWSCLIIAGAGLFLSFRGRSAAGRNTTGTAGI